MRCRAPSMDAANPAYRGFHRGERILDGAGVQVNGLFDGFSGVLVLGVCWATRRAAQISVVAAMVSRTPTTANDVMRLPMIVNPRRIRVATAAPPTNAPSRSRIWIEPRRGLANVTTRCLRRASEIRETASCRSLHQRAACRASSAKAPPAMRLSPTACACMWLTAEIVERSSTRQACASTAPPSRSRSVMLQSAARLTTAEQCAHYERGAAEADSSLASIASKAENRAGIKARYASWAGEPLVVA